MLADEPGTVRSLEIDARRQPILDDCGNHGAHTSQGLESSLASVNFLQRQLFGIDQRIWEVLGGNQIGQEGLIAAVLDDQTASGAVQRIKSEMVRSEALIETKTAVALDVFVAQSRLYGWIGSRTGKRGIGFPDAV